MQAYRLVSLAGILGVSLLLSACNPTTPSQISTGKMRVREQMVTETLDVRHTETGRVNVIAQNILRNGKGAVTLTVPYTPGGEGDARQKAEAYTSAFAKDGVTNISIALVPVTDPHNADKAVIAYQAMVALPAAGCTRIPGYEGTGSLEDVDHYQFGCESQAMMSKMVVDPTDMLGKAGSQDNDSRRSGSIIDPYKAGTPNQPLKGMQASKIGE